MIISKKPGETQKEWLDRIRKIQGESENPPSWPAADDREKEDDEEEDAKT